MCPAEHQIKFTKCWIVATRSRRLDWVSKSEVDRETDNPAVRRQRVASALGIAGREEYLFLNALVRPPVSHGRRRGSRLGTDVLRDLPNRGGR